MTNFCRLFVLPLERTPCNSKFVELYTSNFRGEIFGCRPLSGATLHSVLRYYRTLDKPIKLCAWHLLLESKVSMIHSKGFFINEQMKYVFSNYLLVTLATRYTFEWIFSFMDWSNMLIKVNMYRFCGFEFGHNVTHNL